MMLYRFVDQQKAQGFPVERICDIARVSRSAYYHWKGHRDGISTITELEDAGWSRKSNRSTANQRTPTSRLGSPSSCVDMADVSTTNASNG